MYLLNAHKIWDSIVFGDSLILLHTLHMNSQIGVLLFDVDYTESDPVLSEIMVVKFISIRVVHIVDDKYLAQFDWHPVEVHG